MQGLTAAQGELAQVHQLLGGKLRQCGAVGTGCEFDWFVGTHDFVLCLVLDKLFGFG